MTIVYASDKNYAALTAISAVSALKHNPGARIALLGYNLEERARSLVRSRVEAAGGEFVYRDVSGPLEALKAKGCSGYTSYATYARVFIPELVRDSARVIYLDSDTLVRGSLEELLSLDMGGRPLAFGVDCVPNAYRKAINLEPEAVYYNAGVMLADLTAWRERRLTERFLGELDRPKGPNYLGDQDIFNRVFQDEIALLPPKWNFISHFFLFSYDGVARVVGGRGLLPFTREQYAAARRDMRVCHFLGHTLGRPWYTSSRHPMRSAYLEAAREAGLAQTARQTRRMEIEYKVQYWLNRLLPQTAFDIVCSWLYRLNILRMYRV